MNTCLTCYYWVSRQSGRANAKGACFRYPIEERMFADHWCGEHKSVNGIEPKQIEPFGGRPALMKQLKAAGVKLDVKWTVEEMKAKLEETNERQKTETTDGQSVEEATG